MKKTSIALLLGLVAAGCAPEPAKPPVNTTPPGAGHDPSMMMKAAHGMPPVGTKKDDAAAPAGDEKKDDAAPAETKKDGEEKKE